MPLLNYTTTVAASKTAGQVQAMLIDAGARQITVVRIPTEDSDG